MKYIRKFNESFKPMLDSNSIGDILLDVIDIGYRCHVGTDWWWDGKNSINITIYGIEEFNKDIHCNVDYIYIDDVVESVNRLFKYLKSEGYEPSEISSKVAEVINKGPDDLDLIKKNGRNRGEIRILTGEVYSDGSKSGLNFKKDKEKNKWKTDDLPAFRFTQK